MPTAQGITVTLDEKDLRVLVKRLEKYQGRELERKAERVFLESARRMAPKMRKKAPRASKGTSRAPGSLRRSIRAFRTLRQFPGEDWHPASVGPRNKHEGWHRNLVIPGQRPHDIYSKAGKKLASFSVTGAGRKPAYVQGQVLPFAGLETHTAVPPRPFVQQTLDEMAPSLSSFIETQLFGVRLDMP